MTTLRMFLIISETVKLEKKLSEFLEDLFTTPIPAVGLPYRLSWIAKL